MRIRIGFVSNSSSSSFLLIGIEMSIKDITPSMIKEKQIIVLGDDLCDGQDVFKIRTVEQLAFLKALKDIDNGYLFTYVDTCIIDFEESEGEIDVKKLPKKGKLKYFNGSKDYLSSDNVSTLKERYDQYGLTKIPMQKYLRSKKIKKIEDTKT